MKRKNLKILIYTIWVIFFLTFGFFWASQGDAQEDKNAGNTKIMNDTVSDMHDVDPFKPFIEIRTPKKETKEQEKSSKSSFLTPLQRYSLEEFNLVGIICNKKNNIALVEDSNGKTYTLHSGTHIGMKEGHVEKILTDRVIIIENIKNSEGQAEPQRTILKLGENENEVER